MKTLITIILIHWVTIKQSNAQIAGSSLQVNNSNYFPITFVDRQGNTFKRGVIDQAVGTPYFDNEWRSAKVITTKGEIFENVLVKVHLQSNEFHYKNDSNQVIVVNPGIIKKLLFENLKDTTVFETGFSSIGKNNEFTIYNVLTSGKYSLLMQTEKIFVQSKHETSGEQNNEFKTYINYFTFIDNKILQINHRKIPKIIDELILKKDIKNYNEYISEHTIKSIDDLQKVFNFLNTLNQ